MHSTAKTILVMTCFFICIKGLSQNQQLLWYKGKKLSDTSILTSSGQQVVYSPSSGLVRIKSQANNAMSEKINNSEAFKKQVISIITRSAGGARNIDLANRAAEAIDDVDRSMAQTITASTEFTVQDMEGIHTYSKIVPVWVQNYFDEVVNYVINDKSKEKMIPDPPPAASFDYCFPCDESRKSKYSRDTAKFFNEFSQKHAEMISKGLKVIGYFEHRAFRKLPYDSAAAVRMTSKMNSDIDYLMNGIAMKVKQAWDLYHKDAERLPVLTQLVNATQRQFQLFGKPVPASFPTFETMGNIMVTKMSEYFDEALQRRDYPVLLNIRWYVGLLRQSTLLFGENIPVSEKLSAFLKGNRFEMIIDADANMGGGGQEMLARIKGSNFFRAVPDEDCKLQWYLYDPDDKYMRYKLENVEFRIGGDARYSGTKDWRTPAADIQMGFCEKPVRDTIYIQNFMPNGEDSWIVGGVKQVGNVVTGIFQSCFMDEKRVREAAGDKARFEKMKKDLMEEYQKAIAGNEALLSRDPSTMTKEERERLQKVVAASQNIQKKMNEAAVTHNFLVTGSLSNNLKTVMETELDGKQLFPKNKAIIYAKYKVKLVHVE